MTDTVVGKDIVRTHQEPPAALTERRLGVGASRGDGWVVDRYNLLADTWSARIRRLGFTRAYRICFARIAARLTWRSGLRVADLGIGAADASVALVAGLRRRGANVPGLDVVGVDASPAMLLAAARALDRIGVSHRLARGDLRSLPIGTATCDVVIAAHSIEHLSEPAAALDEIDRIVRPGGTVVLVMTRCTVPTIALEAMWPIVCVRSRRLVDDLTERGYLNIDLPRFPFSVVPNLLSFVCVATRHAPTLEHVDASW